MRLLRDLRLRGCTRGRLGLRLLQLRLRLLRLRLGATSPRGERVAMREGNAS